MSDKYPGGFVTANAPAGYSVALDGSGDYLSLSSPLNFGTNAFTIEGWFYISTTGQQGFWGESNGGGANPKCQLYIYPSNSLTLDVGTGPVSNISGLTASNYLRLNSWNHIVVCRAGTGTNQTSLFINGVRVGNGTSGSVTGVTDNFKIGSNELGVMSAGYISSFRVINGTDIYGYSNTTITPQGGPFLQSTNAILLACQSPTIIDNSASPYTITAYGDAKVSNFTPFAAYTGFNPALGAAAGGVWTLDEAAYYQNNRQWPIYDPYFNQTTLMLHGNGTNAAQNNTFLDSSTNNSTITRAGNATQGSFSPFSQTGWSSYFPATTDYVTLPLNSCLVSSSDFSLEMWVYTQTYAEKAYFNSQSDSTTTGGSSWGLSINGSGYLYSNWYVGGGTVTLTASSATLPLNTWVHIALVRTGGTFSIFMNGVIVATRSDQGTNAINAGATNYNPYINRNGSGSNGTIGYISNFRLIIGSGGYNATQNFTPPTAPLTATTNTRILACQSNRYVDNSANNYTLTPANNASIQAFSPFVPAYITPTTYSNYFDGSTGYLSFPSSANFTFGTGDYTVEAWVNLNSSSTYQTMFGSSTTDALMFNIYSMNSVVIQTAGSNIFATFSGATFATNTWYHVAVSRSSGTVKAFVNGVQYGSTITSNTTNYALPTTNTIGANAASQYFGGCLSNLRIVKGGALYTSNFTPSTEPLTTTVSAGTVSLLTCQNSTFIDNSASANTLTATGSVKPVTSPAPFPAKVDTTTLNSAYSTSLIGGSYYGDGSGDYLVNNSNSLQIASSTNFTFECWLYRQSTFTGDQGTCFFAIGSESANRIQFTMYGSAIRIEVYGGALDFNGGFVPLNAWTHVAIVRTGGSTMSIYINGVFATSASWSNVVGNTGGFIIGANRSVSNYVNGNISGLRLINGTALYTSNFAPPTLPPTAITNTTLLTNFTNGAIFDNTTKNVCETVGTAQISTTQSKYGGSSIKTDGSTSSWVYIPFNRNLDLSTGAPDWTLECWGYVVSFANSPYFFNKGGVAASTYTNYGFNMNTSGVVYCTLGNNSGETSYSFGTCAINTWYHFAATRQGSTIRTFLNGVLVTSQSIATTMTDNGEGLYIGCLKNLTSSVLNGYVDDLRITRGYARYTTNFTPPTSQLQDQ